MTTTPAPLRAATEWSRIEAFVDEYIADYEMRGESEDGRDACYTPNENERALLKDCIVGLLADEFLSLLAPAPVAHRLEGWQSIETAPKDVVYKEGNHSYGEKILVATRAEVLRARWWFHADGSSNFIQDGGAACFPSHWMELPQLPDQGARNEQR